MSLSFIVIGRNEEKNIYRCINSIINYINKNNIVDFQIIYVDSDSSDNSLKIVAEFENILLLKIQGEINAAVARNVGAKFSTKEYLFFIDADMEINSSFYKNIINGKNFIYDFISGDYEGHYYKNNSIVEIKGYYNLKEDTFQNTTGGVFIINKNLWEKVSGMNNKYRRCQDLDLGLRLSKIGFPLFRKKQIIAIHHTVSYYENTRLWSDLFNGNQLYQKSVLYRDHFFNSFILPLVVREVSMIVLFLSLFISLLTNNYNYIFFYFLILIIKTIYKYKNGVSKNFIIRLTYYLLLDVSCLIGFFVFWPSSKKKYETLIVYGKK